jgi:hypothetical protein
MPQGGYHRSDGRWVQADTATGLSQTTVSSTTNGPAVETGQYSTVRVDVVTTSPSGSPSVVINIQTSRDNGVTDPYRTIGSTAAITTATTTRLSVAGLDRFVRAQAAFSGTGSLGTNINIELAA